MNSTYYISSLTSPADGQSPPQPCEQEIAERYKEIIAEQKLTWTEHHRFMQLLGAGGQGVVYLSERRGTDHFTLPVALKIFTPEPFKTQAAYDDAMGRMARVAARVALIQQDNLLDVHNFIERNRIRIMEMEWVDGFDLSRLLSHDMLGVLKKKLDLPRWNYVNNVIVTAGPKQARLKAGIAIAVLRECLAALNALHRAKIVHGDIKPSNIMLKRTGNAKIIDIGSAFDLMDVPHRGPCTPAYAAPEVLEGAEQTERSDLCSLGYVLIETLSGQPPFAGLKNYTELLEAKRSLPHRLHERLPRDVTVNELLMNLIRGLISADPMCRYPTAEAADVMKDGAAGLQRQLVLGNLSTEYENDIRGWLRDLGDAQF
ncbi:MAG: serine/threonine protein kinase [Planctomycetales bacterium]|nr:serine/threonine protein kinase [Planctomycetales bacterium]MBN8626089.1 serine/threonine protein kinase [Planctomycetota bacterium]